MLAIARFQLQFDFGVIRFDAGYARCRRDGLGTLRLSILTEAVEIGLKLADFPSEALPMQPGYLPLEQVDHPLVFSSATNYALNLRKAGRLRLEVINLARQKTIKLNTATQPVNMDGWNIEHVIADKLGRIVDRLEQ